MSDEIRISIHGFEFAMASDHRAALIDHEVRPETAASTRHLKALMRKSLRSPEGHAFSEESAAEEEGVVCAMLPVAS